MTKILMALIVSVVAAACSTVRTNISVSHNLPAMDSAKTVAIMPYNEALAAAPEFQRYAAKLAAHFAAAGYRVVEPTGGGGADYTAFFLYEIDGGTPVTRFASSPHPTTGTIITYGVRSTLDARNVTTVDQGSSATHRIYKRTVIIDIFDRAKFRPNEAATFAASRVFSAWMMSEGSCSSTEAVIDPMLTALFDEFPGESGRFRAVEFRADAACGLNRVAAASTDPPTAG